MNGRKTKSIEECRAKCEEMGRCSYVHWCPTGECFGSSRRSAWGQPGKCEGASNLRKITPTRYVCFAANLPGSSLPLAQERAIQEGLAAASMAVFGDERSAGHRLLAPVTAWMRGVEDWLEHGSSAYEDRQREAEEAGYSASSLGYGSTYYQSWLRIMSHPVLVAAIQQAKKGGPRSDVAVLGASFGWQALCPR